MGDKLGNATYIPPPFLEFSAGTIPRCPFMFQIDTLRIFRRIAK